MESNLYFAIAQRTANGRYINLWINGSDRKEMIAPENLYGVLREKNMHEMVGQINAIVLRSYSMYLLDFTTGNIGLLSALKTKDGVSVMEALSGAKNVIDLESKQESVSYLLNIGSNQEGKSRTNKTEEALKLRFSNSKKISQEADNSFQSFLKNLSNWQK
jgi:hypothetical protein